SVVAGWSLPLCSVSSSALISRTDLDPFLFPVSAKTSGHRNFRRFWGIKIRAFGYEQVNRPLPPLVAVVKMRKETCTMNQRAINLAKVFIAGFVSTFVFHQGLFTLYFLAGVVPRAAYDFRPVPPLAIPSVISLACWGGAWAVAIWPFLKNQSGPAYWIRALA